MDISQLVRSDYERLVAVEVNEEGQAELFFRDRDDTVRSQLHNFQPWLLTSGPELAKELNHVADVVPLAGPGSLRCRVSFPELSSYNQAVKDLKKITRQNPSSPLAPYRLVNDFTQQILSLTPARLFREMEFSQLRRLQLDIETRSGVPGRFPDASRPEDSIILVALRDNTGWETCLSAADLGEDGLLRQMLAIVQERDPDVIEGHNIFNFDLDYLEKRCRRYKIKLSLGRGNRPVTSRPSRFSAGERIVNYKRYAVYGRHVVDTYHLVMLYDLSHRDMDSYGLKAAARYFGLNSSDRTYVEGDEITEIYEQDPARLQAYCLDDVRETEGLSRLLSPSYFYQAQVLPLSYQNCVTRGNATRIDALLCAEYLLRNAALPSPQAPRTFQGGLTETTRTGLFKNVWHIDVRSLYPSIILARNFTPASDNLALFRHILANLRDFRLAAKDAQRQAAPAEKDHWGALQNSFKILINSFYGYLGFAQGTFNDYNMAEKVTAQGREILSSMKEHLQNIGAQVIEMDTDGIYFTPPADCSSSESMEQTVQSILPPGIEVELDATYPAMYAYKSKNYALLDDAGTVHITGAALKSRGLEPFQRNYMREHLTLLLTGRQQELPALLQRYTTAITERRLPLADLAKREVLSVSPETYADKLAAGTGRRSAAYELVLASNTEYRQGDTVQFYVTGNKKNVSVTENSKLLCDGDEQNRDENVPYYLERLQQLVKKFESA